MQNTTNNPDWQEVLRYEFEAGENSFIFQLRCGLGWDKAAYLRLFNAMRECCKAHNGQTHIERWIAEGFWYLDFYLGSSLEQTQVKTEDTKYRENAVVNLSHLAWWLFTGHGRADHEFEPI